MLTTRRKVFRAPAALLVCLLASAGSGPILMADDEAPPSPPPAAMAAPAPTDAAAEDPGAETGVYRGVVTNRKAGKPVEGAVLVFLNENTGDVFEVTTDEKGEYEAYLPAGEYVVDIRVGRKTYRSTGTFREEASGKRWVMDFTIGSKLTDKDLKIETTPSNIRVIQTEPRPPLEPSRKLTEFLIFIGGLIGVAALSN